MNSIRRLLFPSAVALSLAVSASGATILMDWDPEVNDGAFTDESTSNFSPWVSLSTGAPQILTNLNSPGSGGRNFAITRDRQLGYDLGHTVAAGDTYSMSFAWRDAANWDASDTMDMTLFYTDDNLINGDRTTLVNLNSGGRNTLGTWETESITGAGFADAAAVGKNLFLVLSATEVVQGEFARVDDIFVEVEPIPEPSAALLLGLAGTALGMRRRR